MPKPKGLEDVPDLAMHQILDYLDMKSILSLQKVSRRLHTFIGFSNLDFKLKNIEVDVRADQVCLSVKSFSAKRFHIYYRDDTLGTLVEHDRKEHIVEDAIFTKVFARDFQQIWSQQKSIIKELNLKFSGPIPEEMLQVLTKSGNISGNIWTRRLCIKANDQNFVVEILKNADPGILKKIDIENDVEYTEKELWTLNEIVDLPQYKKAENFFVKGFEFDLPAGKFSHFLSAQVVIIQTSAEELRDLKEKLLLNPNFEYLMITYRTLHRINHVRHLFGRSVFAHEINPQSLFYEFPRPSNKILCAGYCDYYIKFGSFVP